MLINLSKFILVLMSFTYLVAAEGISTTEKIISEWDGGYCKKVIVTNNSASDIKWEVDTEVIGNGKITDHWNCVLARENNIVHASGVRWNEVLPAKESTSFGFCATRTQIVEDVKTGESNDILEIKKEITSSWDTGYCEQITVYNISQKKIRWELEGIPYSGDIIDSWNAIITTSNNTIFAKGEEYNKILSAKRSTTFGFCTDTTNVPKKPEDENTTTDINDTIPQNDQNISENIGNLENIFKTISVGFGGSYSFDFQGNNDSTIWVSSYNLALDDDIENNSYYKNIKDFNATAFDDLQKHLKNSKYLVYWVPKGWEEGWFNKEKIQKAMDSGMSVVFVYWYFGDKLNDIPDSKSIDEYHQNNSKFADFIKDLKGQKLVIMEPEFNKGNIVSTEENQHKFAKIISDGIDIIKNQNPKDTYFSLCMTDTGSRGVDETYEKCGYKNCALGDKYEWGRSKIVYDDLKDKLDFVSFQEMVGQFSRDPQNPGDWDNPNPRIYTDAQIGIDYLPQRIINFTAFLKENYHKPVFLPYIAIASAVWNDANNDNKIQNEEIDPNGWNKKIENTYKKLKEKRGILLQKGLFGYAPMALFDDPQHDFGGYQFFMNNEYHLGIMKTGAKDEVDKSALGDITPKGKVLEYIFSD